MDKNEIKKIKLHKSIAMLAPTFIIDFSYPNIIGMLRELGFNKVSELTFGARMVNCCYQEHIENHSKQKYFIASPCPTILTYIKAKYPDLVQYLMPYTSPMLAMARILKKHYPNHLVYFISPCYAKQNLEAPLYPKDIDGVFTLKDLKLAFNELKIFPEDFNRDYQFDSMVQEYTKIYPISGGLARTSHLSKIFKPQEIFIEDGIVKIDPVLRDLQTGNSPYRFLDILNCNGGCIGGPAIFNQTMSIEERKRKVRYYVEEASERPLGPHEGHLEYAEGVDMKINL